MPTYEYLCPEGHEFEFFQKMSEKPRAKCPTCGRPAVRKISGGAGLHFKGTGFYITDYGKDGKGPRKEPAKTESTTPSPATSTPAADAKTPAADAKAPAAPARPEAPAPAPTASKSARKKGSR